MKFKKEFFKWCGLDDADIESISAWEACEQMYESRKCETCKYYYFYETDLYMSCSNKKSCCFCHKVGKDFCCRYWESVK
jgi:hypothetical protein